MQVKKLVDLLASIGRIIEDHDLKSVTLNGLSKEYHRSWTSIGVCILWRARASQARTTQEQAGSLRDGKVYPTDARC